MVASGKIRLRGALLSGATETTHAISREDIL